MRVFAGGFLARIVADASQPSLVFVESQIFIMPALRMAAYGKRSTPDALGNRYLTRFTWRPSVRLPLRGQIQILFMWPRVNREEGVASSNLSMQAQPGSALGCQKNISSARL